MTKIATADLELLYDGQLLTEGLLQTQYSWIYISQDKHANPTVLKKSASCFSSLEDVKRDCERFLKDFWKGVSYVDSAWPAYRVHLITKSCDKIMKVKY